MKISAAIYFVAIALLAFAPVSFGQGNQRDAALDGQFKGLPPAPRVRDVLPGDPARFDLISPTGGLDGNPLILVGELRGRFAAPFLQLPGEPNVLAVSENYIPIIDELTGPSIGGLPAGGFQLNFAVPSNPNKMLHMQGAVLDPAAVNGLAVTEASLASIHDGSIISEYFGPVQANAEFAYSVTPYDLDGDGRDELIIGSRKEETAPGADVGRVRVFKDGLEWLVLDDPEAPADAAGNQFGISTTIADFNSDGVPDIAVGSRYADLAGPDQSGKVVVFFGPSYVVTQTLLPLVPEDRGRFGHRMASGDFDGDGFKDLAVGSIRGDSPMGVADAGSVDIYFGPFVGNVWRLDAPTPNQGANFGYRLESGDVNGDGFDELLVASPFHALLPSGTDASGRVQLFQGPLFNLMVDFPNPNPTDLGLLGADVSFKDLNGDGHLDIVAGAELDDDTFNGQGSVWVLYGPSYATQQQIFATDPAVDGGFGSGVDVGDFNGDGQADLLVGEFYRTDMVSRQGRAQILYGPSFTTSDSFFEPNAGLRREFGRRVRAADTNGDGVSEAVIGVPFSSASGRLNSGAFYVIEM